MFARSSRGQWGAIAITAGALAVAGCSSSSSSGTAAAKPSGSASASSSSAASSLTAKQALQLAGQHAQKVTSFAATMSIQTSGATTSSINGTVEERTGSAPLLVANFPGFSAQGQTLPGGMQEIVTSTAIYLKMAVLSQETGKQWVEFPASELKTVSGANLSQLLQASDNNNNPLVQTQILASAANVRKVGTATVNGVPVTEYTGTVPVSAGLAKLPAAMRAKLQPQIQSMGLSTENFTIWLDSSQQVRKLQVVAQGSKIQVKSTFEITAINEPVTVTLPSASQTATVPASVLGTKG